VAVTGSRPSPRAREFGNLGRIGIATVLWGAFVVLLLTKADPDFAGS
jgi:hypothetical protein